MVPVGVVAREMVVEVVEEVNEAAAWPRRLWLTFVRGR